MFSDVESDSESMTDADVVCPAETTSSEEAARSNLTVRRSVGGRGPAAAADDDDLSEDNNVYMSVMWGGGKLGVAYYRADTTELYVMPDVVETENFDILKKVCHQIEPFCILVRSKEFDQLSRNLKETVDASGLSTEKVVQLLPCVDFAFDACKRRLVLLNLPNIPEAYSEAERTLHLSSVISFDCINMVRAAGALMKYVEKNRIGVELEDLRTRLPVLALRTFVLDDLLFISEDSYRALQIFKVDSHPSGFKSETGREGLSLFGILNKCKSKTGSRLLRMWFLHPLRNLQILNQRQDSVLFFTNPKNLELTTSLQTYVKSIRPVGTILRRMMQSECSIRDWQRLYKTVYNAICIGEVCVNQTASGVSIPIFRKISRTFTADGLHRIANLISKIVDFDESFVSSRFIVKPNIDPALDEKKRTYNSLPEEMTRVAREEIVKLDDDIVECKVLYLPQLGYILAVPLLERMKQTEDYQLPGLDFMFMSDGMLHYKSTGTRRLDETLGDTQCDIMDIETEIMHKLQTAILEKSDLLLDVIDHAAELDCLMCLAYCSQTYNYVQPRLCTDSVIEIHQGRHPVQEMSCSPFVSNDTFSASRAGVGKMKLLTGTNASGKSVYLKQVGLIVFMAHIGSFVPADSATIGIMDKIFTRIQAMESVSINLSSFMNDLNQVSCAIRLATERSLVILDEFGKGTEAVDGIALLCACLKHWLWQNSGCPHVFVSTHFHNIIQDQLLPANPQLKYQTMEVMEEGGELIYLFQLIDGSTGASCALNTAALVGIPDQILRRAAELRELNSKGLPITRVDQPNSQLEFKRCEAIVSRFMSLDLDNDDVEDFLQNYVLPVSQGKLSAD